MNMLRATLTLSILALAASAGAAPSMTLSGVVFNGSGEPVAQTRLQLPVTAPEHRIVLSPPTATERATRKVKQAAERRHPAPMQIGIAREVPAALGSVDLAQMAWQAAADGSYSARIVIESPQAQAIRTELRLSGSPDGITFSFGSADPNAEAFGPFDWSQLESMSRWSPVIEGASVVIEIALRPGITPAGRSLTIPRIAHHDVSFNPQSTTLLKASGIGASGACNIDVACIASQSPVAATTAASVARINFLADRDPDVADGTPLLCSGSLVNSTNAQGQSTQIPYFLTANHCIRTAIAAGTIQFSWFFQAATCSGSTAPNAKMTTGGAALMYTNADVDVTLLRLNVLPPAGVFLAGWDATPPFPGASIFTLHHPSGDLTKFSAGTLAGYGHYCEFVDRFDRCTQLQGSYLRVNYSQGTTEGGSSGGGVYTVDSTGAYRLRGVLHGGDASCEKPNDPDYFSRFDLAFPAVSQILVGVAQPSGGTNAIEYYNVDLDHYFLTSFADETTAIESGAAGAGWVRTGYTFPVGNGLTSAQVAVCRFYAPLPNSHFYTADADECAQVKRDPGWRFEGNAFNILLPASASCPANTIPIFRAYNNGFVSNNSNHRYTTSPYIYQWMLAQPSVMSVLRGRPESTTRWSGESTVMCAPA